MQIRRKSIDSSLRLVKLLSLIPKAGRAIGTKALREKLAEARFDVDLRTVQRDLNRLADSFPLFCEDRRPEPVWSWVKNAAEFSAPGLDASSALAYRIAEQHLSGFFPPDLLRELQPRFAAARAVLESSSLLKEKHFSERFCADPIAFKFCVSRCFSVPMFFVSRCFSGPMFLRQQSLEGNGMPSSLRWTAACPRPQ